MEEGWEEVEGKVVGRAGGEVEVKEGAAEGDGEMGSVRGEEDDEEQW